MKIRSATDVRVLDSDGFKRRAACVCVNSVSVDANVAGAALTAHAANLGDTRVLLVSKSTDKWVFPGGGVELLEDPAKAAEREAFEEAGVRGTIIASLGVFENDGNRTRTAVYVLLVQEMMEDWVESVTRRREWFSVDEALERLKRHKPIQGSYLETYLGLKDVNAPESEAGLTKTVKSASVLTSLA